VIGRPGAFSHRRRVAYGKAVVLPGSRPCSCCGLDPLPGQGAAVALGATPLPA